MIYRIAGTLRYTERDIQPMNLRELIIAYQAYLVDSWDHTSTTAALLYNLTALVASFGKVRVKPKTLQDFHPFRRKRATGLRITQKTIGVLRELGDSLVRR